MGLELPSPEGLSWSKVRELGRQHAGDEPLDALIEAAIAQLEAADPPRRILGVYLLGFSAGMMMASSLLLDDPARYAGAVLLSGAIPFEAGIDTSPQRLAHKPVFHAHGTFDDVIPLERVARTVRYLREQSGAELTDREYPHAHAISRRELSDIAAWLDGRLVSEE